MPDQATRARGARARRARRAAGSVRRHRDRAFRRRAAAGDDLGREGRHGHQLASGASRACARRCRAGRGARRLGDRGRLRAPPRGAAAVRGARRRCSPYDAGRGRSGTSTRERRAAATSTSPACLRAARRARPAAVAVARRRGRRAATRLYDDGALRRRADGRARFVAAPYTPRRPRRATRAIRSRLNTGRLRDQWHGMSRTGTIGAAVRPRARAGARDERRRHGAARPAPTATWSSVDSRRGAIVLPAQRERGAGAGAGVPRRCTGASSSSGGAGADGQAHAAGVNALTHAGVLPAVEAARAEARGGEGRDGRAAVAAAGARPGCRRRPCARGARGAASRCWPAFAFASCVPFGRERDAASLFRAAHADAPSTPTLVARSTRCSASTTAARRRAALRRRAPRPAPDHAPVAAAARRRGSKRLLLAGDIAAEAWLRPLLQDELPAAAYARARSCAAGATAPRAVAARGRQVCSCFDVSETAIAAALAGVDGAPAERRCARCRRSCSAARNCGSCLPELRRIVVGACRRPRAQAIEPRERRERNGRACPAGRRRSRAIRSCSR